jgi:rubrerythrin
MLSIIAGLALQPNVETMLRAAVLDEWHAEAFYASVMEIHGKRRPFSNIIEAERRHAGLLLNLFKDHSLEPPKNTWSRQEEEAKDAWLARLGTPKTIKEAAAAAWQAEVDNVKLYDVWLKGELPKDIRTVFTKLRDDSRDKHMPAFARWKN